MACGEVAVGRMTCGLGREGRLVLLVLPGGGEVREGVRDFAEEEEGEDERQERDADKRKCDGGVGWRCWSAGTQLPFFDPF